MSAATTLSSETHDLDVLARFARERITEALGGPPAKTPEMRAFYLEPGASFVTLRWPDERLQGCIGSLEARRLLLDDVSKNALAAAFEDPRAEPFTLEDVPSLHVEVSVLSPLSPIAFDGTEEGARAALRVGVDGVLLSCGPYRGTFLPQMWEQLPTPKEFLDELKRKAHLTMAFWSPDIRLQRYTVAKGEA